MKRPKSYPSVKTASAEQHAGMVREIFSTIPERYDSLNHILSLRRDVMWRRFAVNRICLFRTNRFLDVATGTADLAVEAALRYPDARVVGLDFTGEMMALGKKKVQGKNLSGKIRFVKGDALALPFSSNTFDAAGIAFGIRNIPQKIQALEEIKRVLVPGGQLLILEMTLPRRPLFQRAFDLYMKRVALLLARALSPNPEAYAYLADSITHFPPARRFTALMAEAGLRHVKAYPLTLGMTHLFIGHKPF